MHELFLGGGGERKLGEDPATGEPIVLKSGRYGPYVASGERKSSLLRSQSPDTLTLDEALQLLQPAPAGRRGPRTATRSSPTTAATARTSSGATTSARWSRKSKMFTVTLDEALALLAAPKTRQRRAAAPPLREMGVDPLTEKPLVIKDGRFGPYVTDGEINASLRRGQTPEALTLEEASEMLAEKRAKGPAPKKKAAQEGPREEGDGEEDDREEDHGEEDRRTASRRRSDADTATAQGARRRRPPRRRPPPRRPSRAAE